MDSRKIQPRQQQWVLKAVGTSCKCDRPLHTSCKCDVTCGSDPKSGSFILVTCGSDPKSDRASPVELPPSPLLSPSPLSGPRGQKMRVREKGLIFYIGGGGGACRPPAGRAGCLPPDRGAAGSRQGPPRKKIYIYLHVGPWRPSTGR